MPFLTYTLLFALLLKSCVHCQNVQLPGYTKWVVSSSDRNDMFCPDSCDDENKDEYDGCCSCKAKPCWEIDHAACGVTVDYLKLEYIGVFGSSKIISANVGADIHVLEHTHGRMTDLPTNICEFNATLTKLDLTYNRLESVDEIKCLTNLDTLLLGNNVIKVISNSTLTNMAYLRVVSFANNVIEALEPNTIVVPNSNIFHVDFSNNVLERTDATNIFREGPFCELRYDNSDMGSITNIGDFKVDFNKTYGPGDMYFNNTNMGQMFDFTQLGITDYTSLSKFTEGHQVHIDSASVACDCHIYQMLKGLGDAVFDYWPDLSADFICSAPPEMVGTNMKEFYDSGNWSSLTCNIDVNCTEGCLCTDKPSEGLVIVDCRNRSLDRFPDMLPFGKFATEEYGVALYLGDNPHIDSIENMAYLRRVTDLRMANDPVRTINDGILSNFPSNVLLDISSQLLTSLPKEFLKLDPNNINFGTNPVECSCDNLWMGNWIRTHDAYNRLNCTVSGQIVPAENVNQNSMNCLKAESFTSELVAIVIAVFLCIFLLMVLILRFQLEIRLLKRKLTKTTKKTNSPVFLSMCDDNDEIFSVVHYCMRPFLMKHLEVTVKTPWYDIDYGSHVETDLSRTTRECGIFVVFLCKMYPQDPKSTAEFDSIWKSFLKDDRKSIIIVNWEGFDVGDIGDKRMRALCRTGYAMKFGNKDRMMRRIAKIVRPEADIEDIPDQFLTYSNNDNNNVICARNTTLPSNMVSGNGRYSECKRKPAWSSVKYRKDYIA